jgi:hypothetical protein
LDKLRKVVDERDARRSLAAASKSCMTLGEWARAHGVDGRSLHAWEMNLSKVSRSTSRRTQRSSSSPARRAPKTGLVELVAAIGAQRSARYAVTAGALTLEFGDDFQEETLRRVLGVLRSC